MAMGKLSARRQKRQPGRLRHLKEDQPPDRVCFFEKPFSHLSTENSEEPINKIRLLKEIQILKFDGNLFGFFDSLSFPSFLFFTLREDVLDSHELLPF